MPLGENEICPLAMSLLLAFHKVTIKAPDRHSVLGGIRAREHFFKKLVVTYQLAHQKIRGGLDVRVPAAACKKPPEACNPTKRRNRKHGQVWALYAPRRKQV